MSQDIEVAGREDRSYTLGFTETVWSAEMMLEAAGKLPQLSDPDRQSWHAGRAELAVIEQRLQAYNYRRQWRKQEHAWGVSTESGTKDNWYLLHFSPGSWIATESACLLTLKYLSSMLPALICSSFHITVMPYAKSLIIIKKKVIIVFSSWANTFILLAHLPFPLWNSIPSWNFLLHFLWKTPLLLWKKQLVFCMCLAFESVGWVKQTALASI